MYIVPSYYSHSKMELYTQKGYENTDWVFRRVTGVTEVTCTVNRLTRYIQKSEVTELTCVTNSHDWVCRGITIG